MARINVEDHKKAIFTLNGIPPFEEEMTFYYDEMCIRDSYSGA